MQNLIPKVLLSFQNRIAFGNFYITLKKRSQEYANYCHK